MRITLSILSLASLLLLSPPSIVHANVKENDVIHTKVVILGAGAAGISAAGTLHRLNQTDFYIVEAQSFVGGRVQHAHFGSSTVELGANWIYGKGANPIYRLASTHGLMTAPNDKSDVAFFDDYGPVPESQGRVIYDQLGNIMKDMVLYAEKRMARHQVDLSSRAALELLGWQPDTSLKQAVEYFALDWELAEPPEVSSLDYATGTSDMTVGSFPFGNEFVVDHRGFNYILKQEASSFLDEEDSRVLLNTVVEKIIYDDAGVTVITNKGHKIIADYAICTFSLGVLQSNSVEFVPRFPDWKREALQSFHMATYTKIFLRFKEKFWADWQFALYANNGTRQSGYYTVWQNLNAPGYVNIRGSKDDNILMVTVTYKESERIERMLDTDVAKEIVDVLQTMFPKINVPMPIDILVPRWRNNPLFRGSYSNWPIGMLTEHHDNMRAPLPQQSAQPRLWFAGEAMSQDYYGYLHGAWIEGQKTARKIMDCISKACKTQVYFEYVTGCQGTAKPTFRFQRQQDGY